MPLPIMTSPDQQNPIDVAGGYGTQAKKIDVLAVGGQYDIWTFTFNDDAGEGAFVAADTVAATVYDAAYPGTVYTVTYTIGSTLDELTVADGFADEWNNTAGASSLGAAVYTSAANPTVAVTGFEYGQVMVVAVTDQGDGAVTVAHTQTGAVNENVEPGRAMIHVGWSGNNRTARRAKSTPFTALTVTVTVAGLDTAGARLKTRYRFAGSPWITVSTVMDTNNDTTVTNHITNLETSFNANFTAGAGLVAATGGAGIFTVQPDTAGNVFELETSLDGPDSNATVTPVWTPTANGINNPTYSFPAAFLGISAWSQAAMPTTLTGPSGVYLGGASVPVVAGGWAAVENSQTIAAGDLVWVDPSTNPGRCYNAAVAGYLNAWHPGYESILRFNGVYGGGTARVVVNPISS